MPATPVAKEKKSALTKEDPRAPPIFPPSPAIPNRVYKGDPSPSNLGIVPPSPPDFAGYVPPSPLFSPPPRPAFSASSPHSLASPRFSSPSAKASKTVAANASEAASPGARTTAFSSFVSISPTKKSSQIASSFDSSAASTSATSLALTSSSTKSSFPASISITPLLTPAAAAVVVPASVHLPVPKSPSANPSSSSSPSLSPLRAEGGEEVLRTPERSPRRPAPSLPLHAPPSGARSCSISSNQSPAFSAAVTPNFPPPPVPTSPQSPSTAMNLLASLSAAPLQSPTMNNVTNLLSSAASSAVSSSSSHVSPLSSPCTSVSIGSNVGLPTKTSFTVNTSASSTPASSATPTPSSSATATPRTSITSTAVTTSTASVLSPSSHTSASSASSSSSSSNVAPLASPPRIRVKHASPTHLKIRTVSSPPPLASVKFPDFASTSSSSSASSSTSSASSSSCSSKAPQEVVSISSSTGASSLCSPIAEGSSEFLDSPCNVTTNILILRESSSSPPVPSSWGAEFRPENPEKKKPVVLCTRCEKVVERNKHSPDDSKKYPVFHSPIYEDPSNVSGELKMTRQGLSRRLPMKTRWCVFNPALCALWYWRTSGRGPKARCLFVTGLSDERETLQFTLVLQFRGRVLVQAATEDEFDRWKQGFSRAFAGDPEVLRIVLPPEEMKIEGGESRRESSIEDPVRPRASTLDRVRSIFVQEFNSSLWKPQKPPSKKKNSIIQVTDSDKGDLWHVGSAPRIIRVDVP